MALILLNPGTQPLGQFDGYDSQLSSFLGGEVCTFVGVSTTGTDLASADSFDGYVGTSSKTRPAVTFTLTSSSAPLFLADDGTAYYGTLFGAVVGGTAGQVVSTGAALGPHTAVGSGKITLWDKPGLYGVTLDAVDTASIVPTNASLAVGTSLTYTATGKLTAVGSGAAVGGAPVVGRFVEFATNGSLVRTPNSLVAALNSGGGPLQRQFQHAVITWAGKLA